MNNAGAAPELTGGRDLVHPHGHQIDNDREENLGVYDATFTFFLSFFLLPFFFLVSPFLFPLLLSFPTLHRVLFCHFRINN